MIRIPIKNNQYFMEAVSGREFFSWRKTLILPASDREAAKVWDAMLWEIHWPEFFTNFSFPETNSLKAPGKSMGWFRFELAFSG